MVRGAVAAAVCVANSLLLCLFYCYGYAGEERRRTILLRQGENACLLPRIEVVTSIL